MVNYGGLLICVIVTAVTCTSIQPVAAQKIHKLPARMDVDAPPTPQATPGATGSDSDRISDGNTQPPDQRYAKAVGAMKTLAIPPFVTYRSAWTSNPLNFDISQDDKRIALNLGSGRNFKGEHSYSVTYRNADRKLRVTEEDREPLVGQGARFLDPTWSGAYDIVRYGLHGTPPAGAAASPSPVASPLPTPLGAVPGPSTIGMVTAISAAYYHVDDRGAGVCPSGASGRVLTLTALSDPQRHPLTEVTIDASNNLFCRMQFRLRQSGVLGVSGNYDLYFAQSGKYWLVSSGLIDASIRVLGIAARHDVLRWQNTELVTPDNIAPDIFTIPTPTSRP